MKRNRHNTRLLTRTNALALFASMICSNVAANSMYMGYVTDEQISQVKDLNIPFTPQGPSASLSLDLSDKVSVNINYLNLTDKNSTPTRPTTHLDISSWGVNINYYIENWSFSLGYSDWRQDIKANKKNNTGLINLSSQSPGTSISASYEKIFSTWQLGLTLGANSTRWQQEDLLPIDELNNARNNIENSKSTFISSNLSAIKLIPVLNRNLYLGTSLSWHYLADSNEVELQPAPRKGNTRTIPNRLRPNAFGNSLASGTETYSQLNFYMSYDVTDTLSLGIDTQIETSDSDSPQSWSVNIGYFF